MKTRFALVALFALLTLATTPASAAVEQSFAFSFVRAPHPMPLDPSLADPVWQSGKVPSASPWESITSRTPSGDDTQTYVLYDDQNLYVAFAVTQRSAPIVAFQEANDVGFGTDDFVGVGLDMSGSGAQAYLFETTPRGTRYQQASENVRYRPQWRSAAAQTGNTWRAVMIIPLGVMRVPPGTNQSWHVNFFRSAASHNDHYVWGYNGVMQDAPAGSWPNFGDVRFWPVATGIHFKKSVAARPRPRFEPFALGSAGEDRNLYQQANGTFLPEKTRPLGIDLTIPLTQTANFVGTLNPDFSNVEIDQQTIAPQEFPRQLQEYRPFFSQGANFLNPNPSGYNNLLTYPNLLFYSQAIGPFDRGEKIEGTQGHQSFGMMNFRGYDETNQQVVDDTVFGYKHLVPTESFQYWADGIAAHHSVDGNDESMETGFKARNLHNGGVVSFNTGVEQGSYLGGVAHSTDGYIGVHRANYILSLGYADISPAYAPLDGYTSVNDIRGFHEFAIFTGSTRYVKNYQFTLLGDRFFDHLGNVHESDTAALVAFTLPNGLSLNGAGPVISYLGGTPYNLVTIPVGYGDGTPRSIDLSTSWGNFGGDYLHLYTSTAALTLTPRVSLGLEYDGTYERAIDTAVLESQWLRRVSLGITTGRDSSIALSLRSINGIGGFATEQGVNFAVAYHARLKNGDVYLDFGTPAAGVTLNRVIAKYVFRPGGETGT